LITIQSLVPILLLLTLFSSAQQGSQIKLSDRYVSPDWKSVASVVPDGKEAGNERAEDRIEIVGPKCEVMSSHEFSSDDGEHGYGLDGGQWTMDSRFFVFRLRNSGGHSPMNAPHSVLVRERRALLRTERHYRRRYFLGLPA
jgi:hypothetical protein